ncbi:DNA-binding protein WhiA [Mycolicibacterium conceptionense]|uniref:DNA-binding protein WhiA n=1 Tax=Mycolicibacterium conceptionense TaxID=451644 RepID=UPI00066290D8|nr:DNA-binding protein WhiA [Mycolicibacterium conceptionense]
MIVELTEQIKNELAQLPITRQTSPSARAAEIAAMVRFGGTLSVERRTTRVEIAVDSAAAAQRLRRQIAGVYALRPTMHRVMRSPRDSGLYVMRLTHTAETLAMWTGLIDRKGRPVTGMPVEVVSGSLDDAAAALRGAFLVSGKVSIVRRSTAVLEIACPTAASAMALSGFMRRHEVKAKLHHTVRRGEHLERVIVRGAPAIAKFLRVTGAPNAADAISRDVGEQLRAQKVASMADANRDRARAAAAETVVAAQRALTAMGDSLPPQLVEVARLRVAHPEASLSELGEHAEPRLTKDQVYGRLRRVVRTVQESEIDQPAGAA